MRRMTTPGLAALVVLAALGGHALGSPVIDSAVINTRIFNDCPTSTLTTVNNYPALITIQDEGLSCTGFANLHNFRLSENGGVSEAVFMNNDTFEFSADVTMTGSADGEIGLNVSPWWSQDVDGRLNVRTTDGEIAAFGGRLPFYSFTGSHGISYTKSDTIRLGVIYNPNSLTAGDPATIEYQVTMGATLYTSGPIAFDEANPLEDPPYGTWGMLNDARVGGFSTAFLEPGNPDAGVRADFRNMTYSGGVTAPVPEPVGLGLIGLAMLAVRRKRS